MSQRRMNYLSINSMSEELSKRTKIINNIRKKKTSAIKKINAKISQRFFVLFILYLFFNAKLLKICEQSKKKQSSLNL